MFPDDIQTLARQVIDRASARGLTIATAESCTGGLVAGALTAIAGSSAVVECGYVTYSNAAKTALVGVPAARIETVSFGEEKPKSPGHDESAWSQNRRADIVYKK